MTEKYDLHCHLFTNWDRGKYSLEKAPREPEYILDAVRGSGMNGIALVNMKDNRYEKFVDSAESNSRTCGKYRISHKLKNAVVFESKDGFTKIIKAQEVDTAEGHMLFVGMDYGKNIKDRIGLEDTLKSAKDLGNVSIADHVFWHAGIGKDKLIKYAKQGLVDSFESSNGNFSFLNGMEISGIEQETGIHGIAASDSHNRRDIGNGYIKTDNLDFSSGDKLRESLKDVLISGDFTPVAKMQNPLTSRLGHAIILAYEIKVRMPMKWF